MNHGIPISDPSVARSRRGAGPLTVILCAAVMAFAAAHRAGAQGNPAVDAEEFALGLAETLGYYDLAEEVIEKGLAAAKSADDRSRLEYAKGSVKYWKGLRLPDRMQRMEALTDAARSFESFLSSFPTSPKAADVRYIVTEVLRQAGEAAVDLIKSETDAAKKDDLRRRGIEFFTTALKQTEARIGDLKLIAEPTDQQRDELGALEFQVGKLAYSQAMLYDNRKGANAVQCLVRAKEVFENYEIDYGEAPLTFQARRILALIHVEEGQFDEAQDVLDANCEKLLDALRGERGAEIQQDPVILTIIAEAFNEKAQFLLATKKPPEPQDALKTLAEIHSLVPGLRDVPEGRQLLVLLAKTYMNEGQADKAAEIAKTVAEADETTTTGFAAREILDKVAGAGDAGGGLARMLENAVARRDIAESERIARRVIARAHETAASEEVAEAVFLLGSLYWTTGRYIDAVVAFGAVADDYPKSKRAPEAKFQQAKACAAARAAERTSQTATTRFWENRRDRALSELASRFPDSEEARAASFITAGMKEDDNQLSEAVDLYAKVPAASSKYGDAQLKAGSLSLTLGLQLAERNQNEEAKKRFSRAEEHLRTARDQFLRMVSKTLNESEQRTYRDNAFAAMLRLGGLYLQPLARAPEKTIEILANAEKDGASRDNLSKVWRLRIQAYIQLRKGQEAAALLEKFQADSKTGGEAGAVADAAVGIAAALDEEAVLKEQARAGDPEALDLWTQAAKFYRLAVTDAKGTNPTNRKQYEAVGGRLLFILSRMRNAPASLPFLRIPEKPDLDATARETVERALDAIEIARADVSDQSFRPDLDWNRARALALLGRWIESVDVLRTLVEKHPLTTTDGRLNRQSLEALPRLADIYLDLAVAFIWAGHPKEREDMYLRANDIIVALYNNAARDGQMSWETRYLNTLNLYRKGDMSKFKSYFLSIERGSPDFDGNKYGLKDRFLVLKPIAEKVLDR